MSGASGGAGWGTHNMESSSYQPTNYLPRRRHGYLCSLSDALLTFLLIDIKKAIQLCGKSDPNGKTPGQVDPIHTKKYDKHCKQPHTIKLTPKSRSSIRYVSLD